MQVTVSVLYASRMYAGDKALPSFSARRQTPIDPNVKPARTSNLVILTAGEQTRGPVYSQKRGMCWRSGGDRHAGDDEAGRASSVSSPSVAEEARRGGIRWIGHIVRPRANIQELGIPSERSSTRSTLGITAFAAGKTHIRCANRSIWCRSRNRRCDRTENSWRHPLGPRRQGPLGDGQAPGRHRAEKPRLQTSHGRRRTIAGKGIANPNRGRSLSGMMLDWLGRRHKNARSCARRRPRRSRRASRTCSRGQRCYPVDKAALERHGGGPGDANRVAGRRLVIDIRAKS